MPEMQVDRSATMKKVLAVIFIINVTISLLVICVRESIPPSSIIGITSGIAGLILLLQE